MKRLFRNWDVLRVIRLLSGAVFAAYGIKEGNLFRSDETPGGNSVSH